MQQAVISLEARKQLFLRPSSFHQAHSLTCTLHRQRKADSTVNREFLNSRSTPPTRASTHVVGPGTHVISFPIPQPNKYPSRPPLSLPFASSILSLSLSARQAPRAPRPQGARAEARRRQGSSPRDLAQGGGGEPRPSGSARRQASREARRRALRAAAAER